MGTTVLNGMATSTPPVSSSRPLRWLIGLAGIQSVLYGAVAWLSRSFIVGEALRERPIVAVLVLLAGCFALYVASLLCALRSPRGVPLMSTIFIAAVAFRAILLFSHPIQEIDIYRYLWDGAVTSHGVSPFRYAPAEVLGAELEANSPDDLQRLVRLRKTSPAMADVLGRIHYAALPTVYPPVSQLVFALADRVTPATASVWTRVTIFKAVLLVFDGVTILLVVRLLAQVGKHPGWAIAYAWCPLVMKEVAGSGHLDAIAVCLTTAALWCAARAYGSANRSPGRWQFAAAGLLGLATGAKLYPVILIPLLAAMTARRGGWARGGAFLAVAIGVSAASLAPMLLGQRDHPAWGPAETAELSPPIPQDPSASAPASATRANDPLAGLEAFLSRWEMNDFLFMLVIENLRPVGLRPGEPAAWFAVVDDSARWAVVAPVAQQFSIDGERAAFLLTRMITAAVFVAIAMAVLWKAFRTNTLTAFLQAAFLTLAWFWLLAPTQNPWYWIWALPLIPFARGRAWLAMSGLVLVYYLRFWWSYHWPDPPVLGTAYDGAAFFDFVITWVEYAPWFLWLGGAFLWRQWHRYRSSGGLESASTGARV